MMTMDLNSTAPSAASFAERRKKVLREARRRHGVDALFITKSQDVRYLCGSTEGGNGLLITQRGATLFTSNMFLVRATRESPGVTIRIPETGMMAETIALCAKEQRRKLGFQDTTMTVSQHADLAQTVPEGSQLVSIGDLVVTSRAIKDEDEIAWTRAAVAIAETAFLDLLSGGASFFIGRTERQLAAELDYRMALGGADRNGFPSGTIVASGANSYNCHHMPGDRVIQDGDPVLFDWGAELHGYRSDITRVVFVRSVPDALRHIYNVVLAAHDAAVEVMGPRVRCHTVDAVARKIIRKAGYAKDFRHGLGHGVGLEIHERPGLGGKPKDGPGIALKPGMIITVEPGVYLEDVGGVRIEDDILVTPTGHERLNALPRTLEQAILS